MRRLAYNFASAIATATLVASVFFGCSQTVVPSEEDIQLAEEQQRILEHSSSSKKKNPAQSSSSDNKANISSAAVAPLSNSLESILEAVTESGAYTTRDSVAAYLCKFDKLPHNYVGKNEGKKLYEAAGNTFSKWDFNPWETLGVMIGGDNFDNFANDADNYHKTLPEGKYHEADVDYSGKNRGTNRLVYQADCVIYYTADHYENFKRLKFE
ncbi:ribonuclease domain-containing protein [Fibrobacter sp.]|uniref:ribonuclease domain-containing protein n=1 Tax=Fibrobacter sp. TaxID=35828 RepID=UPI00388D9B3A